MERSELLKSREYWIAKIQIDLYNVIEDYIKAKKINKTKLAEELGVTKGYITQILNGDFDHKISKLVDLSLAIGKVPVLTYEDYSQHCEDDELGLTDLPSGKRPIIHLNLTTVYQNETENYQEAGFI